MSVAGADHGPDESRLTRRVFLADLGKVSVGLALFGVAACSSDEGAAATSSVAPGTTRVVTSSTTSPTSSEPPATTEPPATIEPPQPTGPPAVEAQWERVVLGGVSAFVVERGGEAAVVDTGVAGSESSIGDAVRGLGLDWGNVSSVLLTHDHRDHIGSIGAVMELAASAVGYAGAGDIPDIGAPRELTPVGDGDVVFGLDVIETPGHTPGHLCFIEPGLSLLFAGDALIGDAGGIAGPSPRFSTDMDLANASVTKIAAAGPDAIVFGHGDPVLSGAKDLLSQLAANL